LIIRVKEKIIMKKNIIKKKGKRKVYQSASVRLKFWLFYKSVEDTIPSGAIQFLTYPPYLAKNN